MYLIEIQKLYYTCHYNKRFTYLQSTTVVSFTNIIEFSLIFFSSSLFGLPRSILQQNISMGKSYFCKVPLMSVLSCKCIRVSIVVSPVLSNEEIIIYMYLPILSRSLKNCIHAPDRSEDPCFGFLFIYSLFDL